MAVIKLRGDYAFQTYLNTVKAPKISDINDKDAGKKPSQSRRKGGRLVKTTPLQQHAAENLDDYVVVRYTSRIKVCNGCKINFGPERYVIRHRCALPYRAKGGVVVSPSEKGSHYFHIDAKCVRASPYHQDFPGRVYVDTTIQGASWHINTLCEKGGIETINIAK